MGAYERKSSGCLWVNRCFLVCPPKMSAWTHSRTFNTMNLVGQKRISWIGLNGSLQTSSDLPITETSQKAFFSLRQFSHLALSRKLVRRAALFEHQNASTSYPKITRRWWETEQTGQMATEQATRTVAKQRMCLSTDRAVLAQAGRKNG